MIYRVIFILISFLVLLFLPWWLVLILMAGGLIIFPFYFEAIILLIFFDLIYAFPQSGWFTFQFFFTVMGLLFLVVIEYLRDRLVVYN